MWTGRLKAAPTVHTMYDHGQILLLPEEHIIERYFESLQKSGNTYLASRDKFPQVPVCLLTASCC